jgi:hypothetical protein
MASVHDFRMELRAQLERAQKRGAPHIEINAGELHRRRGGYPGPSHQMPSCCQAMHAEKRADDEVIDASRLRDVLVHLNYIQFR